MKRTIFPEIGDSAHAGAAGPSGPDPDARPPSTASVPEPAGRGLRALATVGIFAAVVALYASTMATSFVPGDSANYLTLAHTGALTDRGNGVPLYVTLLNAALRFPLPFALSDGVRCNLFTVLLAGTALAVTLGAALRLTGSIVSSSFGVLALAISGLVWTSTTWIMPHVSMAVLGALVIALLVRYDRRPSVRTIVLTGLVCGLGFGLLPDALLFLPVVLLYPVLGLAGGQRRWSDMRAAAIAALVGILVNAGLIAIHESVEPVFAVDGRSVLQSTLFYLKGGEEARWLFDNLTVGDALRGYLTLPLEVAADFELLAAVLALTGVVVGLRERARLHLGLIVLFAIFSMWSGVYPGDTRLFHGLAAYPIAGVWAAMGADFVIRRVRAWLTERGLRMDPKILHPALGALLALGLMANVAVGKVIYRDGLCAADQWYLAGFCRERIPVGAGDRYLLRAETAIQSIPEGALLFGSAWDQTDQMKYLIGIRGMRPDLGEAYDLTKLSTDQFLAEATAAWSQGRPVYLYGEWKDVVAWSAHLLPYVQAAERGPFVYELAQMPTEDQEPSSSEVP